MGIRVHSARVTSPVHRLQGVGAVTLEGGFVRLPRPRAYTAMSVTRGMVATQASKVTAVMPVA